jgi:hypothetical protein
LIIVAKTKALMDAVLKELGAVGCLLWWDPEAAANGIHYNLGADGRCAIAHPWTEEEWLQLVSYFEDYRTQTYLASDSFEYFEDVTETGTDPEGNPFTRIIPAYDQWREAWQEAVA